MLCLFQSLYLFYGVLSCFRCFVVFSLFIFFIFRHMFADFWWSFLASLNNLSHFVSSYFSISFFIWFEILFILVYSSLSLVFIYFDFLVFFFSYKFCLYKLIFMTKSTLNKLEKLIIEKHFK